MSESPMVEFLRLGESLGVSIGAPVCLKSDWDSVGSRVAVASGEECLAVSVVLRDVELVESMSTDVRMIIARR